jgi:APA family basic amino acid/polyamine antiporter
MRTAGDDGGLVRGIGLLATTAMVIGGVIGTGVFLKARVMVCNVETPATVIAVWVVAGLLSVLGALTYAELAATLPRAGGEYVFIREAYGPVWGFLYGWTRFFVANAGGQAALATGGAIFLNALTDGALSVTYFTLHLGNITWPFGGVQVVALTALAIVTMVNCAAVSVGGQVATILTAFKVALVVAVGAGAFLLAGGAWSNYALSGAAGTCEGVARAARGGAAGFGAAMMGALWAYNGWNETTYVAGEVKNPQRNLPLALIGGIATVAALYVFVNAAYFYVLTPAEVASVTVSSSVASEVASHFLGSGASSVIAAGMAISVFGALQIVTLSNARVPYAMSRDGLFFTALGQANARTHVPVRAILAQSVWAGLLVVSGTFDTLTDYAIFAMLLFVALATSSVFIFRRTLPAADRPYRMWGYPIVPGLFLAIAGWLLLNALVTTPRQALAGLGMMVLGLPFYFYWSRRNRRTGRGGRSTATQDDASP